MRRLAMWLVMGIAAVLALVEASAAAEPVEAFIAAEMARSGAPGLAYAVVEDGVIRAGARGEVLAGSGMAVTPDTPFLLGSISKSVTALAVMTLVEAGAVDLDTGIGVYLDDFSGRPAGAITVRHLLSHTSGYSTRQGNEPDTGRTGDEDALARHVRRIAHWIPAHDPGTQWVYSNANYQILGALIERVSGDDYAHYVFTEILEPVGMTHGVVADGHRNDGMATGHRPWFGTKRAFEQTVTDPVTAPAGGVIASANDVARYLAMMMNGEDDIVSADTKALMMQPASPVSPFYGLGWWIDPDTGMVSHTGLSPGVETLAILVPAERKGAVVLVNANGGLGFGETTSLRFGTGMRLLGREPGGEGGVWGRRSLFLGFVLMPLIFAGGMIRAGLHPAGLRAKTGAFGLFSLWFPLAATLALAWTALFLIPHLFGVSLIVLGQFQPDLALLMAITAVSGVLWAGGRLALAYTGRRSPPAA